MHSVDLTIPLPARVEATVRLGGSYCEGLTGGQLPVTGGKFPLKVEFRRIAPILGLPTQTYSTPRSRTTTTARGSSSRSLAGDYHISLTPQARSDCRDDIPPPIFLPNQVVPEQWTLGINAEAPSVLQGSLQVPEGVRVDGWKLDLVDPVTGSVLPR